MKRYLSLLIFIVALLAASAGAFAQLSQCTISGTVFNVNGSPQSGIKIRLVKVEQAGQIIGPGPIDTTTAVDGTWSITVPRSSYAYFCAPTTFVSGMTSNCSNATKKNVPNVASANYSALVTVIQSPTQGIVVQDEGISLSGLITTFDFTGAGVSVAQSATGKATVTISGGGGGAADHNILSATHLDSTAASVVRGDIITGQGATPKWTRLALGASGHYVKSNGTDAAWGAIAAGDLPSAIDAAKIADGSVTNAEFQRLDATSSIQTQLDAKALAARAINTGAGLSGGGDLSADRTLTLALNTLVANQTIFDGSQASRTITFSLSGSTDPVLMVGDGVFNISTGTIQQAGTAVSLAGHAHSAADITSSVLAIARGGTATGTAPSDGKLLIGKTDGTYAVANLSAGSNITITNGDGTIQISSAIGNHNLLSATHGDTTAGSVARGDLITGQGGSATWTRLALGASGRYFRSDGTDAAWATIAAADLPTGIDAAKIADGSVTNAEFQFLDATSSIQTQLNGKATANSTTGVIPYLSSANTFSDSPITRVDASTVQVLAVTGGSAANDDLTLQGTSNATRTTSYVNLQPNGGNVGIANSAPKALLHIGGGTTTISGNVALQVEPVWTSSPGGFDRAMFFRPIIDFSVGTNFINFQNTPSVRAGRTVPTLFGNYTQPNGTSGDTGTITTFYANYVAAKLFGTVTTAYAFVSESGTGNVGIGTTTPASQLALANGSLAGDATTKNFLNITGTMPTTMSTSTYAVNYQITSAGSSNFINTGANIDYLAGYTGASSAIGLRITNAASSTSTSAGQGNLGILASATGTTSGNNFGIVASASGGNLNIGGQLAATTNKDSATNIGLLALGLNGGATSVQIGGYFGLQSSYPTFISAALMADNGAQSDPIFIGRDNGSVVARLLDGGAFLLGPSTAAATGSFTVLPDNAATNALVDVARVGVNSTGTAAAGFGPRVSFSGESSTTNDQPMAAISALWADATHATRSADLTFATTASGTSAERIRITSDGRLYGTALHNNAGAVTGATNQYVASGTYTPTLSNTTNVAASTAYVCQWIRVGNVVTVTGKFDLDATAAAATELGISLPIASALTQEEQLGGAAITNVATTAPGRINADATNDRAQVRMTVTTLSNDSYSFTFTYVVL